MHLETIVIISAVVLILLLVSIALYRKGEFFEMTDNKPVPPYRGPRIPGNSLYKPQNEPYRYEKINNFEEDSVRNLLQLPFLNQTPPPSQPFIPSPDMKHPVPYEAFSALDASHSLDNTNVMASFQKIDNAYMPQTMDLPPVVKRKRMLPPDQQPRDPYSGYPEGIYTTPLEINKFQGKFVPDYLWCKDGVCG
jgi:hypothetical protein